MVTNILGMLAVGYTADKILSAYPELVLNPHIFDNFKKRYNSGILLPGVRCEVCLLGNTEWT
jgi:hypothetical protein